MEPASGAFPDLLPKAGRGASEIQEVAARQFVNSIADTSSNAVFASEQAHQVLDEQDIELVNFDRSIWLDHSRSRSLVTGMCCNFVVEPKVGVDDR